MLIDASKYRKRSVEQKLKKAEIATLQIAFVGCTGAGKSKTINALFKKDVSVVGDSPEPETMEIKPYYLTEKIIIWDTPGLGDGQANDIKHKKTIKDLLLSDYCSNGARYRQIDLVVIIIEASKRDFGTTRQLLEDVIIPTISADRILVAVNQADAAMKGHNWNKSRCRPQPKLSLFLERMSQNIQETIYHDIGVSIPKPIYYSSEFEYNINKLMDLIINHIPKQRRYISE